MVQNNQNIHWVPEAIGQKRLPEIGWQMQEIGISPEIGFGDVRFHCGSVRNVGLKSASVLSANFQRFGWGADT